MKDYEKQPHEYCLLFPSHRRAVASSLEGKCIESCYIESRSVLTLTMTSGERYRLSTRLSNKGGTELFFARLEEEEKEVKE